MAWKTITKCQQCSRTLTVRDRRLGRICTPCVSSNKGRVWGKDDDDNQGRTGVS